MFIAPYLFQTLQNLAKLLKIAAKELCVEPKPYDTIQKQHEIIKFELARSEPHQTMFQTISNQQHTP